MLHAQRFALDNIYCAPGQDKQFSFQMARVHKRHLPPKGKVAIYGVTKHLPTPNGRYQVFTIGNIPSQMLNLLSQKQSWLRDTWIQASGDMVARNFLLKVYNADGLNYPRQHVYYSFIDENSLVVALEVTDGLRFQFPIESFNFLHVYSNAYFNTTDFNTLPKKIGIDYRCMQVNNNLEKVQLQSFVTTCTAFGGDVYVYVNGYYVPRVCLNIPDGSLVEVVYDQSVLSREVVAVKSMRTFSSELDGKMKYLMYRIKTQDHIQYEDDTEVYVTTNASLVRSGLYFYKHKAHAMRNVTDKDYSFNSQYLNNTCIRLGELVAPGLENKELVVYTRRSGRDMPLVYSALKLHELYKLPDDVQLNVVNNTGYTLDLYRAEKLEASDYFKLASAAKMSEVTPELATQALGYAALTHYYADTPQRSPNSEVGVPELYQWDAVVFEYDIQGRYLGKYVSNGALYTKSAPSVGYVEFMKGKVPLDFGALQDPVGTITLIDASEEVVVVSAYFEGVQRQSVWEDATPRTVRVGSTVTWNEDIGKKVKVVRFNELNLYDLDLPLTEGSLYFPLTIREDRGTGVQLHPADIPYLNVSLYLNGYYLTEGIDYQIDFPYVSIFSKKYLNYQLPAQKLHVRCSGITLDKKEINHLNIKGFVNNGTLTRNSYYDLRDDRVYSVFVDGKLYDRSMVHFSEEDNTVRTQHPMNGLPYTVRENFIPIKFLTGQDSQALYRHNVEVNKKIAGLFNLAYPEPPINPFNVIGNAHYLFSPVVSKIINDIVKGVLPESFYNTPYNDNVILVLLEERYKALLKLDPVKLEFPATIIEIHPHLGNSVVPLNLLQYRFVQNVIRLVTNNHPERINLSGYIALST